MNIQEQYVKFDELEELSSRLNEKERYMLCFVYLRRAENIINSSEFNNAIRIIVQFIKSDIDKTVLENVFNHINSNPKIKDREKSIILHALVGDVVAMSMEIIYFYEEIFRKELEKIYDRVGNDLITLYLSTKGILHTVCDSEYYMYEKSFENQIKEELDTHISLAKRLIWGIYGNE